MFTGEVHPYAAAFPMLPDADLDALAADIKANGLAHPLVLTPDGALLDGRNRLAACERCGVKPDFVVYEGDPIAYVITLNMQRRDLTQGQKAHLLIAGFSKLENPTQGDLAAVSGVTEARIAEAAIVARFAPEASRAVIEKRMSHVAAYDFARGQKKADEDSKAQLAKLMADAPDLLSLEPAEAWAAYQERTKKERELAEAIERNRVEASTGLASAVAFLAARSRGDYIARAAAEYRSDDVPPSLRITADALDHAIRTLTTIRQELA